MKKGVFLVALIVGILAVSFGTVEAGERWTRFASASSCPSAELGPPSAPR